MGKIEAITMLCCGVLFLFIAGTLYSMQDKTGFSQCCGGILFVVSIPVILLGVVGLESFVHAIGVSLGFTGLLFILLVILSFIEPNLKDFAGFGKVFFGIILMGAGWFAFSPPAIGSIWGNNNQQNKGDLSIMVPSQPATPFGLDRQSNNNEDGGEDIIDRMLSDILNADTSLSELARTNPDLSGKIQSTFNYYNPNAGVFGSWARRVRGEGRTKLLTVLNEEQKLLIDQAALFEQKVREGARSQVEFKTFLAQNALQLIELRTKAKLNAKAFDKEMLPEDWSKVRTEQEFLDIRLKEEEARSKRKLEEEEAQHQREQKAEEERIRRNLESARAFKMNEDAITDDLRTKMAKALIEIDQIEARTDISVKTKAALKIAKENEAENLRRRIAARERKAATDEESFL